ncbi:hydantoinase/oxoprolinase family protein [Agrobacterium genomosp. 3 str. RTP8]|uniref:hydantoinase/oxoprolinase family protein n=1 Tax=Agrobacterium tomkonis TaxID=1183410 RepID=UPI001CDA3F02|nr:hydantoinase/oxoprolinase family protein [Agrobacterium tomkonis RTP8]
MWRVGVDVGGTFTDLFAWEEGTGAYRTAKVLTTKKNRSLGVVEAVKQSGVPFEQISYFMHGTTTATNALLERNYPDAAFITTEGFRDTLEIGRQSREFLYDPYQSKPKPLIKRRYRFVVGGRVNVKGEVRRPLDEQRVYEIAKEIDARGIPSVGVGFINAYVNPVQEQRVREIIKEINPAIHVVISSETRPVFREHARFVTTAIRACMMPVMSAYFDQLDAALRAEGFTGSLLILKSNGGVMGAALAKERPEELIESGPAGGVAYAAYLSEITGLKNIIHTDVGGTSFDASIVENGVGLITRKYELEWEVPVSVPMLDIHSVGAGGGSLAWLDKGGSLRMGPQSAGSEPGPACYGRGGTQAAITDANLVLGRLHPSLGDKFVLDKAAAEKAVDAVAERIGLSRDETAEGMIRISCETMAQAVKRVVTERSRDPRDFVLASFGGAGPMHACFVAQAMGVPKVLVPAQAGVASAFGATAMNLRHDLETFFYSPLDGLDVDALNAAFNSLEANAIKRLEADGYAGEDGLIQRSLQMRYVGQTYEVDVDMPEGVLTAAMVPALAEAFHLAHKREYGVSATEFPVAIVSVGVSAIGKLPAAPEFHPAEKSGAGSAPAKRDVFFNGAWIATDVFSSNRVESGQTISGPAIVEYPDSCAILPPGSHGEMDKYGNLLITLAA